MQRKGLTRRDFLHLSTLTIAGLVAASCTPAVPPAQAPAETSGDTAAPASGDKQRVTIFVGFGTGTAPEQVKAENELADEYNASQDKIAVEYLVVPYEDAITKFTAMVAAGTAPELCMPIGVDGVSWFLDEWVDIEPYISRDNYDLSDFYTSTLDLHKNSVRNATFGLPGTLYPSMIYYNEELFDAAGLDYPPHSFGESDWTYARLEELALQMSMDAAGMNATEPTFDRDNQVQWGYDESCQEGNNPRSLAMQWGSKHSGFSEDYRTARLNDPEWIDRWQWVSDAIWKKAIMASEQENRTIQINPFLTGKVAMYFCHTWTLGEAFQDTEFAWNIAAVPAGPTGAIMSPMSADTFTIPSSAQNPDAGWEVAKWMFSETNLPKLCGIWNCLSARQSGQEAFKQMMQDKYPRMDLQVIFDAVQYLDKPLAEGWVPSPKQVLDLVANSVGIIRTGDNQDAKAVLDALNVEVQKVTDEYWAQRS